MGDRLERFFREVRDVPLLEGGDNASYLAPYQDPLGPTIRTLGSRGVSEDANK